MTESLTMGFYEDRLLPRLIDRVLSTGECIKYRKRVVQGLHGTVLEVGFGSGLNLPYYPEDVQRVHAVDPSELGRRMAEDRICECHAHVEYAGLDGARLELPDDSVDAVLSTWTLCTIPEVDCALEEMRRVLKPGGALHFLEHGRSSDAGVARWQDRIDRAWGVFSGGCHLNRSIDSLVEDAGFRVEALDNFEMRGPRVFTYMYQGRAIAP
ncbi:MAG: class I SAM-dependent methyltransferase [Myxococcales bacterium]